MTAPRIGGPKFTYSVEVKSGAKWVAIVKGERRDFCLGFFLGRRELMPPRLATRMMRSDGRVVETHAEADRVALGMIAGFPPPEQYEAAAAVALKTAEHIRECRRKNPSRSKT